MENYNEPTSPQAHKPTSPQAHKPTSPQAHKPTSLSIAVALSSSLFLAACSSSSNNTPFSANEVPNVTAADVENAYEGISDPAKLDALTTTLASDTLDVVNNALGTFTFTPSTKGKSVKVRNTGDSGSSGAVITDDFNAKDFLEEKLFDELAYEDWGPELEDCNVRGSFDLGGTMKATPNDDSGHYITFTYPTEGSQSGQKTIHGYAGKMYFSSINCADTDSDDPQNPINEYSNGSESWNLTANTIRREYVNSIDFKRDRRALSKSHGYVEILQGTAIGTAEMGYCSTPEFCDGDEYYVDDSEGQIQVGDSYSMSWKFQRTEWDAFKPATNASAEEMDKQAEAIMGSIEKASLIIDSQGAAEFKNGALSFITVVQKGDAVYRVKSNPDNAKQFEISQSKLGKFNVTLGENCITLFDMDGNKASGTCD